MARKIVMVIGVVLLVAGGFLWWKATHPTLTDEQQIVANLETVRTSAESASVDGVMNQLSDDFRWNGQSRSEVRSLLFGAFYRGFHKRDIRVTFTAVQAEVKGETATLTGHYKIDTRADRTFIASPDGDFSTMWVKKDGRWKIATASGGESVSF